MLGLQPRQLISKLHLIVAMASVITRAPPASRRIRGLGQCTQPCSGVGIAALCSRVDPRACHGRGNGQAVHGRPTPPPPPRSDTFGRDQVLLPAVRESDQSSCTLCNPHRPALPHHRNPGRTPDNHRRRPTTRRPERSAPGHPWRRRRSALSWHKSGYMTNV